MSHCTALHCTALHCTALHCTALHCKGNIVGVNSEGDSCRLPLWSDRPMSHCTALHCTALHCTALHCTALHCTALSIVERPPHVSPAAIKAGTGDRGKKWVNIQPLGNPPCGRIRPRSDHLRYIKKQDILKCDRIHS
jgi:hypothetical protein